MKNNSNYKNNHFTKSIKKGTVNYNMMNKNPKITAKRTQSTTISENKTIHKRNLKHLTQIKRAKNQYIYDYNQRKYLDFDLQKGSLLFGHANSIITKHIKNYVSKGIIIPSSNGLDYQLRKILLSFYSQMSHIQFYENEFEILNTLIQIILKKLKNEGRKHTGKILFLVIFFYISYGLLIKKYPYLIDLFKEFFYFLPSLDLENLEKILKKKNSKSFFQKFNLLSNNKDRIEMICLSPVDFTDNISILSSNFYEKFSTLCQNYQIITVLDKSFLTLRIGLKGYHPSYFIKSDFFILGNAIGGGLPLYAILTKTDLLDHNKKSFFNVSPYIAGISTLKYILHKNPYENIKENIQYFKYKMNNSNPSLAIKYQESFFYMIPEELNKINYKKDILMSLEEYLNYNHKINSIGKNIYQKFFYNNILLNRNFPFVGFFSYMHDKNDIRFFIKQIKNIQL